MGEIAELEEMVETDLRILDLMRGKTRMVAERIWFGEHQLTWREIADEMQCCERTVGNERERAIEEVACFLKRSDYRLVSRLFL